MKPFRIRMALPLVIVIGCLFVLMACGRKALPTPVSTVEPPVVANLQAKVAMGRIILTWRVPASKGADNDHLAGFRVYRYMEAVDAPACEECPRPFVMAAEVGAVSAVESDEVGYTDVVKQGMRYFYRVSCYTEDGVEGEKSRVVTVDP